MSGFHIADAGDVIADALETTADQLMAWASSAENKGPFDQEAYRVNLHISGAFNILAENLRAAIAKALGEQA